MDQAMEFSGLMENFLFQDLFPYLTCMENNSDQGYLHDDEDIPGKQLVWCLSGSRLPNGPGWNSVG